MKKILLIVVAASLLIIAAVGCASQPSNETNSVMPEGVDGQTAALTENEVIDAEESGAMLEGTSYESDSFSIIVPDGWEVMDVDGGVQLYKTSGEIIEVHYRGSNQGDDHAKQQVENLYEQYSGTTPVETELLGKTFWKTTFTTSGVYQTSYMRMENGEMLSVKLAGANHENDPEFEAIVNSVVFK